MPWIAAALLVIACAATGYVFAPAPAPRLAEPPAGYRKAQADFLFASDFKRFDGRREPLAPFAGRPLLVYFWAAWCAECRDEAAAIDAFRAQRAAEGLQVIAIGTDQSDKLQAAVRERGIGYPVFVGGQEAIDLSKRMGNLLGEMPYTVAIDRRGEVAAQWLGRHSPRTIETLAAAALR